MNKCKGCEWYGKPYWSIINPCENCPREETNVEIITRWIDPTIEEKDKETERLNNNWNELKQWIEKERDKWEKYHPDCFVYYQSILDRMEEIERWTKSETIYNK